MAPMPAISLPPKLKGSLPRIAAGLLLLANMGYMMASSLKTDTHTLWKGPVMAGKSFPLPERPKRAAERIQAEAGKKNFAENEPLRDVMEEQKARKAGTAPVDTKASERIALEAMPKDAFLVQAGSFVLKLGAETLLDRLRKNGLNPQMVEREEMVQLNDVQAGPYPTLEEAKIAEAKLKAGGLTVKAVETWEGFVITLGKFYMLGYAVEMMERAEKMKIVPVRMVKVESALKVHKVLLGPFTTKDAAKQVSVRVSQLGMAVPVIKTVSDEDKDAAEARKLIAESKAGEKEGKDKAAKPEAAPPAKTPPAPTSGQSSQTPAKAEPAKSAPPALGEKEDALDELEGESVDEPAPGKIPDSKKGAPRGNLPQSKG